MKTLLVIIVIPTLIFTSCCRNNERTAYNLTAEQQNSIGYDDMQQLKFTNSDGLNLLVEVNRSLFFQNYNLGGCAECCDELVTLQVDASEFASSDADIVLPVIVILPYADGNPTGSLLFMSNPDF